ncbi:MAG: sugar MFS transporter, partial [Woeseia sp.]
MRHWPIRVSLFINYFVFAILLNSVGTVILQVQNSYRVSESAASVLEAFKDLPIAITSFLVASFIARIGYKRSMLIALAFIGVVCLAMPQVPAFWMSKLVFAATGVGFALTKVSVFAALGLVTGSRKEHVSWMNFLESFFLVGVLSGY